ncbi:MAG: triacylglycerol lipase [Paraglaciecola sp.]|jgi:triacylglycerol lipase
MADVDFNLALQHAERSAAAYNTPEQIHNQFTQCDSLSVKELSEIDVLAFVEIHDDQKMQWVVVRGTANFENVKLDADYIKETDTEVGVPLHKGFWESSDAVYKAVRPLLKNDYQTRVTGHSLGGAIAAILMMRFHNEGLVLDQCITFGQPKVTNEKGVERYRDLPLLRFINNEDPVPLVPPLTLLSAFYGGYRHFGPEVLMEKSNNYKFYPEHQAERFAVTSFWTHIGREDASDHHVESYVENVRSLD